MKIFKIESIIALLALSFLILPLFLIPSFTTEQIDSAELKSQIDANGIIYIRSQYYNVNTESPISTSWEIEDEFANWFNDQINSRVHLGSAKENVDYKIEVLGGGDFSDSKINEVDSSNGGPDTYHNGSVNVKEMEITPLENSSFLVGGPIDFYFIVAPSLSIRRYIADDTISGSTVPFSIFKPQSYFGILGGPPGDFIEFSLNKYYLETGNTIDNDEKFSNLLKNNISTNLIGWNYDDVQNSIQEVQTDINWVNHNNAHGLRFIITSEGVKNHIWFDQSEFDWATGGNMQIWY